MRKPEEGSAEAEGVGGVGDHGNRFRTERLDANSHRCRFAFCRFSYPFLAHAVFVVDGLLPISLLFASGGQCKARSTGVVSLRSCLARNVFRSKHAESREYMQSIPVCACYLVDL